MANVGKYTAEQDNYIWETLSEAKKDGLEMGVMYQAMGEELSTEYKVISGSAIQARFSTMTQLDKRGILEDFLGRTPLDSASPETWLKKNKETQYSLKVGQAGNVEELQLEASLPKEKPVKKVAPKVEQKVEQIATTTVSVDLLSIVESGYARTEKLATEKEQFRQEALMWKEKYEALKEKHDAISSLLGK
ncbi:hypothetical protein [Bacillus paranthracis]|uniref:hypothetical protein n=1 Tax=Bacillus paranthracis TaxID=2026186 RepID=UPI0022DECF3F|nr:hypothetical protein [Bacillus paranthracis]